MVNVKSVRIGINNRNKQKHIKESTDKLRKIYQQRLSAVVQDKNKDVNLLSPQLLHAFQFPSSSILVNLVTILRMQQEFFSAQEQSSLSQGASLQNAVAEEKKSKIDRMRVQYVKNLNKSDFQIFYIS
ncbi:unnamed protein product (macronuclear) [Paramecium tetraurelia]|uniref:Uncharacterized protein n=1 Tax=Paramecium tetraurelia TaxID=5888 RepID=A0EBA9_PARTE|nr:uncharacterized protein GSPATT00025310001 [Paramecium tetraurelia]CAK92576.1 unnamed protein product [Paramecium tetraurelia]|eukprot:XP_001459973.1 hypothetical protein (macronuclear) [Paramecium tetraurelia strain d4-2]